MKVFNPILLIFLFVSCTTTNKSKVSSCHENMKFKKSFFDNISIVEKYTLERTKGTVRTIGTKDFLKSLNFISNYTKVSMDKVANYEIGYPSFEIFEEDKDQWIKWYNDNKCNNLKE